MLSCVAFLGAENPWFLRELIVFLHFRNHALAALVAMTGGGDFTSYNIISSPSC